ncbi:MFS transporter [Actinomadura atramentaria]|uniref:MFS transporter n=1 Tax=Actinomadura atramentaria TaxID=1990 RepID=UPI001F0ABC4C|nr:MFS transporter [Actinomadura atramentaria]
MPETTLTAPPTSPVAPASARRRWLGVCVISLGVSLIIVDATVVGVLLPQMVSGLGLTSTDAEWVTSVYALVFAALLIPAGRAGDLFGRRRLFLAGTAVFALASLGVAAAHSGSALVGARALQGVGASMIMPAALSTLNTLFTGRDRHIAFGIWGSMLSGMAALGPLIGGGLATGGTWRWAFWVNLPLGAALVAGAAVLMPETRGRAAGSRNPLREIDWAGGALATLGLGALVCGIIEGQSYGWWTATAPFHTFGLDFPRGGPSPVPVVLALGAVLIAALVLVERARATAGRPVMLDLALFRIPNFRNGNLASALINVGELGLVFILPLFMLGVHGTSPIQISLAILPLAVGAFLSGGYAGHLGAKRGPHRIVQVGMALEVAAVLGLAVTISPDTGGLGVAPWMLLYGIGLGLTSAQLTNASLADVPPEQSGQASGTQSTARQIGAALGIALIGTVFATSLGRTVTDRLTDDGAPPAHAAAVAHDLRHSAGTYARELHADPRRAADAHAADAGLAAAARDGALVTALILAGGLALSLRLRPSGARRPEESAA